MCKLTFLYPAKGRYSNGEYIQECGRSQIRIQLVPIDGFSTQVQTTPGNLLQLGHRNVNAKGYSD